MWSYRDQDSIKASQQDSAPSIETQSCASCDTHQPPGAATASRPGPAVLAPVLDTTTHQRLRTHRLEIACQARISKAGGIMTDVVRLLFDEGTEVMEADTLLDDDLMSMCFLLKPTVSGPRSWSALVSKVNAAVHANCHDVAASHSCMCQVHELRLQMQQGEVCLRTVWDVLHDCSLQALNCSMQTHRAHISTGPDSVFSCASGNDTNSEGGDMASECIDMSFVVVDLLQQLRCAVRQSAVIQSVTDACGRSGGGACSISITERHAYAAEAEELQSVSHCFCQQRRMQGGFDGLPCPDGYLEEGQDGRRRFARREPEGDDDDARVDLFVDDTICKSSTCVEIKCSDRKGLLYDALRTVVAAGLYVTQARCRPGEHDRVDIQLFLKNQGLQPLLDNTALRVFLDQLWRAISMPVSISVLPAEHGELDVLVIAPLDAGLRGRPRVARDVAAVLSRAPLRIDAVFVGALDDFATQNRVPGDVLHQMMATLSLPAMENQHTKHELPTWTEAANKRLMMYTSRMDETSSCSPCAEEVPKSARVDVSGCSITPAADDWRGALDTLPVPTCNARSQAREKASPLPVLHDLEQRFCSAFLDDDFVPKAQPCVLAAGRHAVPAGLLDGEERVPTGAREPHISFLQDNAGLVLRGGGSHGLETGMSFFGPATAHSHFPEGAGRAVEMHHFVVAKHDSSSCPECSSPAMLHSLIKAELMAALTKRT